MFDPINNKLNPNRKGTGFTNVNRILEANKGNKLGNTVSSGVQNQADDVRSGIQQSQQKFQEDSSKTRLDTEDAKNKRDEVIGRFGATSGTSSVNAADQGAQSLAGTQAVVNNVGQATQENAASAAQAAKDKEAAAANAAAQKPSGLESSISILTPPTLSGLESSTPILTTTPATTLRTPKPMATVLAPVQSQVAPVVSDQEIADFDRYRTGTYTGPNELNDFQTILGKSAEAEQVGNLTRSVGGRQELLRKFVGGNDYSQGQQRLDTMLLGQQNQGELNQARKATRGLQQTAADANQQAGGLAQEYGNRAKIFGEDTVNKLTGARAPISNEVDTRLGEINTEETNRKNYIKSMNNMFTGQGQDVQGLDRITRLGLGLQQARDSGLLNDVQVQQLLGDEGLINRAETLGLDTNQLINERIQDIAAKNINRGGAANSAQEAKLTALDRLLGKAGTDVEFNQNGEDYQRGGMGFDLDSMNDYISKSEQSKYANDAQKLATANAYNKRYMVQAMNSGKSAAGNVMESGSGVLNQLLNPKSYYDPGVVGQNVNQMASGSFGGAVDGANGTAQAENAMLDGIAHLKIGDKSLADTEGGRQLLKAIELKSKMENAVTGESKKAVNTVGKGIQDLFSGDIRGLGSATGVQSAYDLVGNLKDNLIKELGNNEVGKIAGNINNTISDAGKSVGNVASNVVSSVGSAAKKLGKKFKKAFSDENLKHDIKPADNKIYQLLDKLNAHEYEYDKEVGEKGKHISVMAQELEKSELGKPSVGEHKLGKTVDYEKLAPVQLAGLASLHKRIQKLEKK
jgi:phage gp37-like protein